MSTDEKCPSCKGAGIVSIYAPCSYCNGSGSTTNNNGDSITCPACGGAGKKEQNVTCPRCNGSGKA